MRKKLRDIDDRKGSEIDSFRCKKNTDFSSNWNNLHMYVVLLRIVVYKPYYLHRNTARIAVARNNSVESTLWCLTLHNKCVNGSQTEE